jgi:hypothetical protein
VARSWADLPVPQRDPGEVRRAVHEVLARPEFRRAASTSIPARVRDWLVEHLVALLARIAGTGGSSLALVLFVLLVAAVAVLVWRFSRGLSRDAEVAAALAAVPRRSGAEWRAEAAAHEQAGDWRQAVRCRYRALVADLAARGLVEEVPGRTAGEYRGEVGGAVPAAAADFAGVTELFERAWYGHRPTGPDDAAHLRDLAARVLERAGVAG